MKTNALRRTHGKSKSISWWFWSGWGLLAFAGFGSIPGGVLLVRKSWSEKVMQAGNYFMRFK
jgi:hypothetical protein